MLFAAAFWFFAWVGCFLPAYAMVSSPGVNRGLRLAARAIPPPILNGPVGDALGAAIGSIPGVPPGPPGPLPNSPLGVPLPLPPPIPPISGQLPDLDRDRKSGKGDGNSDSKDKSDNDSDDDDDDDDEKKDRGKDKDDDDDDDDDHKDKDKGKDKTKTKHSTKATDHESSSSNAISSSSNTPFPTGIPSSGTEQTGQVTSALTPGPVTTLSDSSVPGPTSAIPSLTGAAKSSSPPKVVAIVVPLLLGLLLLLLCAAFIIRNRRNRWKASRNFEPEMMVRRHNPWIYFQRSARSGSNRTPSPSFTEDHNRNTWTTIMTDSDFSEHGESDLESGSVRSYSTIQFSASPVAIPQPVKAGNPSLGTTASSALGLHMKTVALMGAR